MAEGRPVPYAAFNFTVNFDGGETFGGFSEASGLSTEITMAEYRNGNDPENHVSKIPCMHSVSDVTLKRGIIDSLVMWQWIADTRVQGPLAKKSVSVILQDESHNSVQKWVLYGVSPLTYNGPSLNATGGGEAAIEELVLSCEGFTIEAP